jgi:hypothetical protein
MKFVNVIAWVFMAVILALIIIAETMGYGGILWALMGPQLTAITLTACALGIMSSAGVVR